jgi:hypothetical protein
MTTTPGAIGSDGTTLTILPNRVITNANTILKYANEGGLTPISFILKGFHLKRGGDVNVVDIENNAPTSFFSNCVFDGAGYAGTILAAVNTNYLCPVSNSLTTINSSNFGVNLTRNSYAFLRGLNNIKTTGINVAEDSYGQLDYSRCVAGGATTPVNYVCGNSYLKNDYSVILGYNYGVYCSDKSYINCSDATIKDSNIGVYCQNVSYIYAISTQAKMSGNTTNYSPATSNTVGNIGSYITYS